MIRTVHQFCNIFFFFNDTATTEIYTLSLHDALPISALRRWGAAAPTAATAPPVQLPPDRKSTRLNSSHSQISYAVFCLKKKKIKIKYSRIKISNKYLTYFIL